MSWASAAPALKSWPCWLWSWNSYLLSCRIPHFSRRKIFCFPDFRIWLLNGQNEITLVKDLENFPFWIVFWCFRVSETRQFCCRWTILRRNEKFTKTFVKNLVRDPPSRRVSVVDGSRTRFSTIIFVIFHKVECSTSRYFRLRTTISSITNQPFRFSNMEGGKVTRSR